MFTNSCKRVFSDFNSALLFVVVAFAVPIVLAVVKTVVDRMEVAVDEVLTTFCFYYHWRSFVIITIIVVVVVVIAIDVDVDSVSAVVHPKIISSISDVRDGGVMPLLHYRFPCLIERRLFFAKQIERSVHNNVVVADLRFVFQIILPPS